MFIVELEYRIALRKTELGFVDDLIRRIRERKIGGIELWEAFHSRESDGDEVPAKTAEKAEKWRPPEPEK